MCQRLAGQFVMPENLPMIGKPLVHTQVQTTARYAHLTDDPIHSTAERMSGAIVAVLLLT